MIGRSSQDSYPFTSFAAAMGHANFRGLSFIHIINGRDTFGYSFSMNDITTLVDFADDGAPIEITIYVCDQSQQLFVNSYFHKRRLRYRYAQRQNVLK